MVRHSKEMSSDADKSHLKGASLLFMPAISLSKVSGSISVLFPLSYDSGANNCRFNSNWNFVPPFITRLTQYLDREEYYDIFILSDADDLAPELHEVRTNGEQE